MEWACRRNLVDLSSDTVSNRLAAAVFNHLMGTLKAQSKGPSMLLAEHIR